MQLATSLCVILVVFYLNAVYNMKLMRNPGGPLYPSRANPQGAWLTAD